MLITTRIAEVRQQVAKWRAAGERVAFVPTMGNLHAGHISLIELAAQHGDRFVASLFVNPMQFGPNEDFNHYPRTPQRDESMLRDAGCDLMFTPDVAEMYPNGHEYATRVEVPTLSDLLCGEFRPGHFQGVATVVAKLFNIVQPDVAVFGQKDFQQLTVIRRMTADLCLPIEIIGAPTVRESDGLAMSSRNQYLTAAERATASTIHREIQRTAQDLRSDRYGSAARAVPAVPAAPSAFDHLEARGRDALFAAGFKVDYFAIRRASDLLPPQAGDRELVILVAARLGKARLIDNLTVTLD